MALSLTDCDPTRFPRHRLGNLKGAFRVCQIEPAHVLKVAARKSTPKLARQSCRKVIQQVGTIFCPIFALLLLLDDAAANFVVGMNLQKVNATGDGLASRQEQRTDVLIERNWLIEFALSRPRMPWRISALSRSRAAISSSISCGERWTISSLPFGFLTERSKVFLSIVLTSIDHDCGESTFSAECRITRSPPEGLFPLEPQAR
jgi:hypothetical protein